jgi:hypothetical protein
MPTWDEPVAESFLFMRATTPVDDPWRRYFDCGSKQINDVIRRATWYVDRRTPVRAMQYGTAEAIVGYALIGLQRAPHPSRRSRSKKLYLYVDYLAVSVDFRSEAPGARPREHYSDVMLRHVVDVIAPYYAPVGIVGLYAITQEANRGAIKLLARHGFVPDSDPAFDDARTGDRSVLYRRLLPAAESSSAGSRSDDLSDTGRA